MNRHYILYNKVYGWCCLMAVALLTMLSACGADDMSEGVGALEPLRVELQGVAKTRAAITGSTLPDGSRYGIFVTTGSQHAIYDGADNVAVDYKDGKSTLTQNVLLGDDDCEVFAYYPYSSNAVGLRQLYVDVTDQTDVLYGVNAVNAAGVSPTVNRTNPVARLKMEHALTMLTFRFSQDETNTNTNRVTALSSRWFDTAGYLDLTTGEFSKTTRRDLQIACDLTLTATPQSVDVLLLPCVPVEPHIQVVLNGTSHVLSLFFDTDLFTFPFFEAGKRYIFDVGVQTDGTLTITEAQIVPRENQDMEELTAGEASDKQYTYTPGEKVFLGFNGDNGKRLYWSSWNLGATKPEGYGYYYAWGELEPKTSFSWENYSLCNGTAETCKDIGSDISGTAYDAARHNWGDSWRMPTESELQKLCDNCSSSWETVNGVSGVKFTGSNGNSIFLPGAGYYSEYDSSGKAGLINYGFYLSGTFAFTKFTSHLVFGKTWHDGVPYFSAGDRYAGYPIRPVTY